MTTHTLPDRHCAVERSHTPHAWTGDELERYYCDGLAAGTQLDLWNPADMTDDWAALFTILTGSDLSSPQGTSRLRVIARVVDTITDAGFARPPM